jgi:hypothetical protein
VLRFESEADKEATVKVVPRFFLLSSGPATIPLLEEEGDDDNDATTFPAAAADAGTISKRTRKNPS